MKGNFAKTRFVAHAYGERDEVFAGTPPLEVARTLLALTAQPKLERNQVHWTVRHYSSVRALTS